MVIYLIRGTRNAQEIKHTVGLFTRIDIHCKLNGTYETCKYDAFQIFVTLIFMQAVFPILNIGVLWDESILPMREYAHVTFILN